MKRSWLLSGLLVYALLTVVIFPYIIGVPWEFVFGSDAIGYSTGAKNLLFHGFYSFDGVSPYMDREPIMSAFLVPIYAVAGIENGVAVAAVQAVMLFLAAWFFCERFARITNSRTAGITFLLILTSGSVLHTVFSAYRECLVMSLLLVFVGLWLQEMTLRTSVLMGLVLGLVILTYYSFVLLPFFLLATWVTQKRPLNNVAVMMAVCVLTVSLWGLRNYSYDGQFRIIDSRRAAVMWYVRGEQAERIRGLEPFWCLWSEYISRDWTGRSSACSYNGLMHLRWPADDTSDAASYAATAAEGKAKIIRFFPWYLWFSLFEILELHLPYVGGGWSHAFNVYAAVTQLLLAIGFLLGLLRIHDRRFFLLWTFVAYNTGVFIFTDATPRYMLPVFFCYAAIAGIGYDLLLKRFTRHL